VTARLLLAALALAGCDLAPPVIESTTRLADGADPLGPYVVQSIVREVADGDHVELRYAAGTGPFIPRAMTGEGDRFTAAIPGQSPGTEVRYLVAVTRRGDELARDPADPTATYRFAIAGGSD
jgi:hypothetical protein